MNFDFLEKVSRPGRYIGGEWNAAKKPFDSASVKVALCYPDVYEIGMSHLGFKILYHLLNEQRDVVCERVFAPWPDMQEAMKQQGIPLFSLESKRPLLEFDFVGFSLCHELNYTNILAMLQASGMPLEASNRDERFPLVIGGGVCAVNPQPIAEFFDAFFIGEAEEGILEIVSKIKNIKSKLQNKNQILKDLAGVEGVYVPSQGQAVVKKRIVKDFENSYYPVKQIVPYIQIVHDRISLEIMRGCPNRCHFCQAQSVYHPARFRSADRILRLAEEAYRATGYDEISLVSLSTGDHPHITEIAEGLIGRFKSRNVSISLPSLRAEDMLENLPKLISSISKTGLTFAPEAGSQRLRDLINKRLDIERLYNCVVEAAKNGWRRVKLYFMIGLPQEEERDLEAIAELVEKIARPDKAIGKQRIRVSVSVSTFVPRPHTVFQRYPMVSIEQINKKQAFLRQRIKSRDAELRFHDPQASFIEAVLSRGDRQVGAAILNAYKAGAKFDSWREHFNFNIWQEAFKSAGIDPEYYVYRQPAKNEALPWSHINCGV